MNKEIPPTTALARYAIGAPRKLRFDIGMCLPQKTNIEFGYRHTIEPTDLTYSRSERDPVLIVGGFTFRKNDVLLRA